MSPDNLFFALVTFSIFIVSVGNLIQITLLRADSKKIEKMEGMLLHLQTVTQTLASSMAISMATQAAMYRMLQSALTTEYRSLDGSLAAGSIEELMEKMRQNGITPPNANDPGFKKFLEDLKKEADEDGEVDG